MQATRILGIDPGYQWMGLGCVEKRGSRLVCIGHRLVVVKTKKDQSWAERLRTIYAAISEAIDAWAPASAAIEDVFMHKNASSALKLGQARGAAIAAVAMRGLTLAEFGEFPKADAADALAVAICQAQRAAYSVGKGARGPIRISARELKEL